MPKKPQLTKKPYGGIVCNVDGTVTHVNSMTGLKERCGAWEIPYISLQAKSKEQRRRIARHKANYIYRIPRRVINRHGEQVEIYKYIYWKKSESDRSGYGIASVHLLAMYHPGSIEDYKEMAGMLKHSFPHAKDKNIRCHSVSVSSYCCNFCAVTWEAVIVKGKDRYRDWTKLDYDGPIYPGYRLT